MLSAAITSLHTLTSKVCSMKNPIEPSSSWALWRAFSFKICSSSNHVSWTDLWHANQVNLSSQAPLFSFTASFFSIVHFPASTSNCCAFNRSFSLPLLDSFDSLATGGTKREVLLELFTSDCQLFHLIDTRLHSKRRALRVEALWAREGNPKLRSEEI